MPRCRSELKGKRFGRLEIIEVAGSDRRGASWLCRCSCEALIIVYGSDLQSGNTRSCGCLRKEQLAARNKANRKHGMFGTRTYRSWEAMKARCTKPDHIAYKSYGGRGIVICNRWLHSFKHFLEDMGERPGNKTLDRIDNDGNYTPKNCRWAGPKTQRGNQRKKLAAWSAGKQKNYEVEAGESISPSR